MRPLLAVAVLSLLAWPPASGQSVQLSASQIKWNDDFSATFCGSSSTPLTPGFGLELRLQLPYVDSGGRSCLKLLNGSASGVCTSDYSFSFVFGSLAKDQFSVTLAGAAVPQADVTFSSASAGTNLPSYALLQMSPGAVANISADCSVNVTYSPTPRDPGVANFAGRSLAFAGSFFVKNETFAVVDTQNMTAATLRLLGPRVRITASPAATASVEAGDSITVAIRMRRHPDASEDAANVNLNINFDVVAVEATVVPADLIVRPGSYMLLDASATSTEALVATFTIGFNDSLPLGSAFNIYYSATFNGVVDNVTSFRNSGSLPVAAAKAPAGSLVFDPLPLELPAGSRRSGQLTLTLPKGSLQLRIAAEFSSSALSPIPGRLLGVNLTSSDTRVSIDRRVIAEEDVSNGDGRLARATTAYLTSRTPVVAIVNPSTGASGAPVTITFSVGLEPGGSVSSSGLMPMVLAAVYSGTSVVLATADFVVARPVLAITNTLVSAEPSNRLTRKFRFTTFVQHTPSSTLPAYTLELNLNTIGMTATAATVTYRYADGSTNTATPTFYSASTIFNATGIFTPMTNTTTLTMVTDVTVTDVEYFYTDSDVYRRATVFYYSHDATVSSRQKYASVCSNCSDCLRRQNEQIPGSGVSVLLVILLFFIGLLVGAILALLLLLLWLLCLRCRRDSDTERLVDKTDEEAVRSAEDRLILSSVGKGENFKFDDLHPIKKDDSILVAMDNDTTAQVVRDLDTLDVIAARHTDQDLEDEYDEYRVLGCRWVIGSLVTAGAVTELKGREVARRFEKDVQTELAAIRDEETRVRQDILERLAKLNKEAFVALLNMQRRQRNQKVKELKDMGCDEEYVDSYTKVMDEQFAIEREDKIHQLRLEQEAQLEQSRELFASRKREAIGRQSQKVEEELAGGTTISDEQLQWYRQQHERVQAKVNELNEQELGRQRLVLAEKLQRRRLLAGEQEVRQDQETELLNELARQQISMVKKLNKSDEITPEKMEACIKKIREDLANCKEAFDDEKRRQRKQLAEERNRRKANLLRDHDDKGRRQFEQLRQRVESMATQTDEAADAAACIEQLAQARARQRTSREELDQQLDEEDIRAFEEKMAEIAARSKDAVVETKEALTEDLREADVDRSELSKLLRQHEKQLSSLQSEQARQREEQQQALDETLRKRQEEMSRRLEEDRRERQELKERERAVVQDLLNQQLSLSDDERARIVREHERNVSMMQQNLTSERIRQQKLLDEAYARRKAESLRSLQQQHSAEQKRQTRRMEQADSDDEFATDRQQLQKDQQEKMLKQAKAKLDVMRGEDISVEEEMEAVKAQMLDERSEQLREQEERLAAVIAQLQLDKAKEMAKIEEQQQAISQLKLSLLDDLAERRIFSDDRCKEILQEHEEQLETLLEKKERDRERQQKKMQQMMQRRIAKRHEQLMREQEQAVEEAVSSISKKDKVAAQLRRAMIEQKHAVQAEKFRKQLEWEMDQQLQESRRQHQKRIQEILQEEEFRFIGTLAQFGRFTRSQVLDLVCALFPTRSRDDLQQIVDKMMPAGRDSDRRQEVPDAESEEHASMLLERSLKYRRAMMESAVSAMFAVQKFKQPNKRVGRGELRSIPPGRGNALTPIDAQGDAGFDDRDDPSPWSRGGDLPQVQAAPHKKKKKSKKKLHHDETIYEDELA